MIDTFVAPIMGHWQKTHEQNGLRTIWRDARLLCNEHATVLPPLKWNSDWKSIAQWLAEELGDARPPVGVLVGYSYGGGWGCQRLSEELRLRLGFDLQIWQVLSDPVSRNGYGPLWPLNALNVSPWGGRWRKVRPPANVTRCWYVTQSSKAPYGQTVVLAEEHYELQHAGRFQRGHSSMDELPEFQEAAQRRIAEAINR